MINNRFLLFFISITILSSCVTPKVYNELVAQKEQTNKNSQKIKSENISLNTENTELKDEISRVKNSINKLEKDTF